MTRPGALLGHHLLPGAMVDHAMLESIADDVLVYEPQALPTSLLDDPRDLIRRVDRRRYFSDMPAWAVVMILSISAGSSATWNRSSSSGPMLPSASIVSLSQPSSPFQ